METLLQDLRYAFRTLARTPSFSLAGVGTLGLGVGVATAIFTVVHGVLLQPLPYPEPDRIVRIAQVNAEGRQTNVSDPNFLDLQRESRSVTAMAQFSSFPVSVSGGLEPARVQSAASSREFFAVLGTQPRLGRTFTQEEQREGGPPAVIVSHGFWLRLLGGEADLTSLKLVHENQEYPVVGVMPPGFEYPGGVDLWTPREAYPTLPSRTAQNWQVIGRLGGGATLAQAQQELSAVARRLKQEHGEDTWMVAAAVIPLHEFTVGRVRPALLVLLGAAGFLLLITCANVANLLLARMASRQREVALRLALGAGRWRLARQLLTESLVLALAGGAVGVLVAYWGTEALLALEPGNLPRAAEVGVGPIVAAFAFAVALLVAAALAVIAVLHARRGDLRGSLIEVQRSYSGGPGTRRMRGVLIAGQYALTLVLVVGAGLLARTFHRLTAIDPGFRTTDVVTMNLALPSPDDEAQGARLVQFHDELLARVRRIPGVQQAGGVNDFPLGGNYANGTFLILNRPGEVEDFDDWRRISRVPERTGYAEYRVASDGYFEAMGIPLLRGRLFDDRDTLDAAHAAVISESLARSRWPGQDPLGRLLNFGNMDGDVRALTIVGIVGDIRERALDADPQPTVYATYRQRPGSAGRFTVAMRSAAEPSAVIGAARRIVRDLDPAVPPRFRTIEEVVTGSRALAERRFSLALLAVFGGAALLLAVMGIYGVTAYTVAQRTREIGIRVALGAQPGSVLGLVLRAAAILAAAGVVLGAVAAYALTGLLTHLLYEVSATDPVTFGGAALVLIALAVAAAYLPARRAAGLDPVVALRAE